MESTWLLLLLVIPLIGAVACALTPDRGRLVKLLALAVSAVTALVGLVLAAKFDWRGGEELTWASKAFAIESVGFGLKLGVDSVSLWLVLLTVFLMPLAIAGSFGSITDRQKQYYGWMLLLLAAMLGVFIARDLLLFYVFFELTLIPMFFIIGIWGGPERRYAAAKFFLFTFAGSVFTLAAAVHLGIQAKSFDISACVNHAQTV